MVQRLNIVPTALSSHDAAWLRKSWPLYFFVAVSLKILIEIQIHKNRPSYWDNFGLSGGPHGPTLYWLTRCKHGVKYFKVQSRDFLQIKLPQTILDAVGFLWIFYWASIHSNRPSLAEHNGCCGFRSLAGAAFSNVSFLHENSRFWLPAVLRILTLLALYLLPSMWQSCT